MGEKELKTEVTVKVELSQDKVAYLLRGAFMDLGTQLEVYRDDVEGPDAELCDGDLVAKQLFNGGTALLIEGDLPEDADEEESWELTAEGFMYGLKLYLESGAYCGICERTIDIDSMDPSDMSAILLCAINGCVPWEEE